VKKYTFDTMQIDVETTPRGYHLTLHTEDGYRSRSVFTNSISWYLVRMVVLRDMSVEVQLDLLVIAFMIEEGMLQ